MDGRAPESSSCKSPLVVGPARNRQGDGKLLFQFGSQSKALIVPFFYDFLKKDMKAAHPVSRFPQGKLSHPGNDLTYPCMVVEYTGTNSGLFPLMTTFLHARASVLFLQ
jgi:hypothetical protein